MAAMQTPASFALVRFDLWLDPVFDERMRQTPAIALSIAPSRGDDERAWRMLSGADIYQISAAKDELPRQFHADAALLARCPGLLCVSSAGAGYDTIDVHACTRAGVAVVHQAGANAHSVAEMAIGLMLAVARRIAESDRRLRSQRGFSREALMGRELAGKTLGIVGIGHAGTATARLAAAFGMRVLATDPYVGANEIRARGAEPVPLDELVAESDIVSLHCPRDHGTLGMFDAARFAAMRSGAIFISTARGGIHDEAALAAALADGHLMGAGIDVWETEPPPLEHPLLARPDVVATFHTAGVSREARRAVAAMAAEQISGLVRGIRPPCLINPQVWDHVSARLRARSVG
ncbi:MAG: NAD(P)-dependent oxidoreductase [Burkholderiaceae bacterium]